VAAESGASTPPPTRFAPSCSPRRSMGAARRVSGSSRQPRAASLPSSADTSGGGDGRARGWDSISGSISPRRCSRPAEAPLAAAAHIGSGTLPTSSTSDVITPSRWSPHAGPPRGLLGTARSGTGGRLGPRLGRFWGGAARPRRPPAPRRSGEPLSTPRREHAASAGHGRLGFSLECGRASLSR